MTVVSIGQRWAPNPFSTRHVRPGKIAPLDVSGRPLDIPGLIARLAAIGGSAAIVGPHGSGKTTLLMTIADVLEAQGERVEWVRLRESRDLVGLLRAIAACAGGGTACVDSAERMGSIVGSGMRLAAWLVGARMLVTAHRRGPLQTLVECATSVRLLAAIVERLSCRPGEDAVSPVDVAAAFEASRGDIREALFLLYDRFERRARHPRGGSGGGQADGAPRVRS